MLLVEDEAAVRRAVQRALVRLGYCVIAAQDGEEAVRFAENLEGIDLLLTAGHRRTRAVCHRLQRHRLARTGVLGPHDRVLEKPYQPAELAHTIRQMLEARRARAATGIL